MSGMQTIGVIGAGAWGTALAQTCAQGGRDVRLWAFEPEVVEAINIRRENSVYLPNAALHEAITATSNPSDLADCDAYLVVTPAQHTRATLAHFKDVIASGAPVLLCSKGFERESLALMTDDDAVPVLAALDTMRETGACLLMEAHAGHSVGEGGRNFRPRGSAALMGWPEFGYGLKPISKGYADLIPWRGDRDNRNWPDRLRHDRDGIRWVINDNPSEWTPTGAIA